MRCVGLTAVYAHAIIPKGSQDAPDVQGEVFLTFIPLVEYYPVASAKGLSIVSFATSSHARNLIVGERQTPS